MRTCLQVGARNMQNFSLLRKLAPVAKPILVEAWAIGDGEGMVTGGGVLVVGW